MKNILIILFVIFSFSVFSQSFNIYKSNIDTMYVTHYEEENITTKETISIIPLMVTVSTDNIYLENINTTTEFFVISTETDDEKSFIKARDDKGIRCNIFVYYQPKLYVQVMYRDIDYIVYLKQIK